jgi:hypothetical protein
MAPLDANAMAAAAAAARQCIRADKAAGGLSSHPADKRADACPARDECVGRGRVATRSLSQPRSPPNNNCSEDGDSAAPQESPASASASASASAAVARAEWARRRYAADTPTHTRAARALSTARSEGSRTFLSCCRRLMDTLLCAAAAQTAAQVATATVCATRWRSHSHGS